MFYEYGCIELAKLAEIQTHEPNCDFDPKPIPCPEVCGAFMAKIALGGHDCRVWMRDKIGEQAKDIVNINRDIANITQQVSSLNQEVEALKITVVALRGENQDLKVTNESLKTTNESLKATNESLKVNTESLELTIESLKAIIEKQSMANESLNTHFPEVIELSEQGKETRSEADAGQWTVAGASRASSKRTRTD
jgi:chromosome segregation ATPase